MSHVVCLLNVEADRATFTWSEGPASFEPYKLEGMVYKDFQEAAAEAREKLADLVKDYLDSPHSMPQSAFELAEAGYELYQTMFQPGAEQARQAKQVRTWLEELSNQREVDTLEIVVESPWSLPWNIVYDRPPDKAAFLANDDTPDRWKPFWGLRYNLAGGRRVDPLRRMPLLKEPKVLLVIDSEIESGLPAEQQQRLVEFASQHSIQIAHTKEELQTAIAAARPDVLYWLSHASPEALVLAGEEISPRHLRKLLRQDDDENFGGLAFLNACQTAEGNVGGSFFEALHNVGFAGMIGTEHQTVDTFAHPLGLDFLEAFLDRGEPVGAALRELRARVPLGLLYGTYCPPDIRVDQGNRRKSLEIQQIHVQGLALSSTSIQLATTVEKLPPLPEEPYRSLAYYDRPDRALFAGREDDVERFATLLDDASTRILVLHGESGVGKSSFLRAGVIPYLEDECLGYRFLRTRNVDVAADNYGTVIFIRATNDLFGQLAQALCEFCAKPYNYRTPLGEMVSVDLPGILREATGIDVHQATVRAVLRGDPPLLGRILETIGNALPFTVILIIDQGEEVFTLAQTPEDQQRGRLALDMLRRTIGVSGDFKVIFCLRTEYYGRCIDRLRRGLQDTGRIREYLLTDFDESSLTESICRPTAEKRIPYASEIPFEKYRFRYAPGVAEEIARRVVRYTTQRHDSVLPLMQVVCSQLYRIAHQRSDKTITLADLERLGGIAGGMRNHVEGLLRELLRDRPSDKRAVQKIFTQLYLKQPDGTLTTALLAEEEVRRRWTGQMPFDKLLKSCCELRLLKVNNLRIGMELERRYVSLGHDALAKQAACWDDELTRRERGVRMFKRIAAWASAAVVLLSAFGAILAWTLAANKAEGLVARIESAMIEEVPRIIKVDLPPYRHWADPILRREFERQPDGSEQKLHVALALMPVDRDGVPTAYLQKRLRTCWFWELAAIRDALEPHRATVVEPLWDAAIRLRPDSRDGFQAACALATYTPDDPRWSKINRLVANHLMTFDTSDLVAWRTALKPARHQLVDPLEEIYRNPKEKGQARHFAADVLANYLADNPTALFNLLADAEHHQFQVVFDELKRHREQFVELCQAELKKQPGEDASEAAKETLGRRQANVAVALLKLGNADDFWKILRHSPDPRTRTYAIHWLSPLGADPNLLVHRFDEEPDVTIRRALLLALGEFTEAQFPPADRAPLILKLRSLYETDPDPGLHAAAEWLLRQWGNEEEIGAVANKLRIDEQQLRLRPPTEKRQWYVNSQGATFVILEAGTFLMGSPDSEPDRYPLLETLHRRRIGRTLAISAKEVTMAEYRQFLEAYPKLRHPDMEQYSPTDDSPQVMASWYDAACYCNWLSEKEGIAKDQWCYEPNEEGEFDAGMHAAADFLQRTGYRLPTEAEWEFACRAGTVTSRYYGSSDALLAEYAWTSKSSPGNYSSPTGRLKPNDFGLFDPLGNAMEWCQDGISPYPVTKNGEVANDECDTKPVDGLTSRDLRGGSYYSHSTEARCALRSGLQPYAVITLGLGFRVVRTYR
jgi:formylglycine-generating enzyme required for sulfatase activity